MFKSLDQVDVDARQMDQTHSPSNDRKNVSFTFTKKTPHALTGNRLVESDKKSEKDFVTSVARNEIKSSLPKEKEKDLIIPLIRKNNWRVSDEESQDPEKKIRELAIKELLQETAEKNEEWQNRDGPNFTVTIPLIMQNKVPEGFETDDKMDVSLRPNESTLDDYEKVPIDKYGLAILRGMGWKEGDPIGAKSKECVAPVKVQLRPKGLGLGADTSALKKIQDKMSKEEKLDLIKGSYVHIIQGSNKGHYGQVLGLDEENARAIVKLTNDKTITFPEFYINVISKKVFDKESKVINRGSYEKYKEEIEQKVRKHEKEIEQNSKYDGSISKEDKKRHHETTSSRDKEASSAKYSKKRKHSKERSLEKSYHNSKQKSWIRPQLKVRLIDDVYKKGRYFNTKLIIVDVLSPQNCTCKTEDNKYLDDISPSMLETVIPRTDSSYVMIVQGKYTGELCTILKRDKYKCLATVQFLSDRDQALQIGYDSICEYVGDVSQFD